MAKTLKNTTLRVGALEVPIAVRTASSSEKESVDIVRRVKRGDEWVPVNRVEVAGGKPFKADDVVRGVERDGAFVPLPKEQLEHIAALTARDRIEVVGFVDESGAFERMPAGARGTYWIAPQSGKPGAQTLAALAGAMWSLGKVGVAKVAVRGDADPSLAYVWPVDGSRGGIGLMVTLVSWLPDVDDRIESAIGDLTGVDPSDRAISAAESLICAMGVEDDAVRALSSDRQAMIASLVDRVVAGQSIDAPAERDAAASEDALIEALEASVAMVATAG